VKEMTSMHVCNTENDNCVYKVCSLYPGAGKLNVLLQNELHVMTIEYKQCVVTEKFS
jgi:hypothetical protein